MDDLRRTTARTQADVNCFHCGFNVTGVWAETARKRAREHVRANPHHEAYARYQQTDYYKADGV